MQLEENTLIYIVHTFFQKGEKVLVLKKKYRPEDEGQNDRAMSEPPDKPPRTGDDFDGGGMSKGRSEGHLSVKDNMSDTSSLRGSSDTLSASSLTSSTVSYILLI